MKIPQLSPKNCRAFVAALGLAASLPHADAQQLLISNPHWNITVSDFGYSDFMLDNTPGFEGREYLSGEWAAAVGYQAAGHPVVSPQWLERQFIFPDWTNNSSFGVQSPMTQTGLNTDGLPIARSILTNADLEITLQCEMIDTVVGTPMGTAAASSTGDPASVNSDRYVLKQTCTVRNISGVQITDLQFFQLLHGLNAQRGVFDNRLYAGALGDFRHDATFAGVDPWAVGAGSSSAGLEDLICMHSSVAPTAFEIGHYGIEGNGVDDHFIGKPSDGVHLSVEDNWQTAPYAARQGTDSFAPAQRWVAGAMRWDLGALAPGQSTSLDVILSLLTGTRVAPGNNSSGGCNGGSSVPGGIDYEFDDCSSEGSCFAEFSRADEAEIEVRIAQGEFDPFTFHTPGGPAQVWEIDFTGGYSGLVHLTFAYDPTILPAGLNESGLCIYQFSAGAWQKLPCTVNVALNTIQVSTATLSAFVLGLDDGAAFTIQAGAVPPNSGTLSGAGSYIDGSQATLVATAQPGYVFSGWTENGSVISLSPNLTWIVHSNRTLVATFDAVGTGKVVTTAALPANGGTTEGDGEYALGSSATVVATAGPGYKFSKWRVGEVTVSTSASYTFEVTGDVSLVAKFKPVYVVTALADPENAGEVEVDPVYEFGELAKLKATPIDGYCFVNWTQNGIPVSGSPLFTFNVTGNRELVAHFAAGNMIHTLAEPLSAGATSGGGVHAMGAPVTVTAVPAPGYVFLRWVENGIPVSTAAEYSFTSTASRDLVANFVAQPALQSLWSGPDAVTVSWPMGGVEWLLQECGDMGAGGWTNSTRTPLILNGRKEVTVSPASGTGFFRLRLP